MPVNIPITFLTAIFGGKPINGMVIHSSRRLKFQNRYRDRIFGLGDLFAVEDAYCQEYLKII